MVERPAYNGLIWVQFPVFLLTIYNSLIHALMMELVYIRNLKFRARMGLGVRVPLRALTKFKVCK